MKDYRVLIPNTLCIQNRINKNPPNFDYNLDYFHYLIGLIAVKTVYNYKERYDVNNEIVDIEEKEAYVSLCSDILNNNTYNYKKHIYYLCENFSGIGNVLWRQDYAVGKCYSYKLSGHYALDPFVIYTIKDKKLLKYIKKNKIKVQSSNKFKKSFNFLQKYFESEKLKIDVAGAVKTNNEIYEHNYLINPGIELLKQRLNAVQIAQIANEEYCIQFNPESDGRLHTNITRLNKKIRAFLTYNGKRLAEVDISASVPTILYYILREISNSEQLNPHLEKIFSELEKSYKKNYPNKKFPYALLGLKSPKKSILRKNLKKTKKSLPICCLLVCSDIADNNNRSNVDRLNNSNEKFTDIRNHYMSEKSTVALDITEIESFGHKLLNNSFYESFEKDMHTIHHFDNSLKKDQYLKDNVREMFGREFDGDTKDIRKVLKKRMLAMFNAKPAQYLNEEAMFNMHYPSILRWLKKLKKRNHKIFSYLTLQAESYLILNLVARKFNKKHGRNVPLFTLHDCLITTEDNLNTLYQFMSETLLETLKFKPNLTKEVWN